MEEEGAYSLSAQERSILGRLAELAVPRDEFPSAADVGAVAFVERVLAEDRPDWRPRVLRALEVAGAEPDLDAVLADSDGAWLVRLVAQGFYAGDGHSPYGERPPAWEMVGWRPDAAGTWETTQTELTVTPRSALAGRYDCVIIGSGAGGGAAAQVLAESGRSVLVVETGCYPSTESLTRDHLRNPRSTVGLPAFTDPDPQGRPRVSVVDGEAQIVLPPDGGWGNNAFTVGGGTRVYGAQAWRFAPRDFTMASTYGVPEGSALADWPITYADLEPYYSLAEQRFGVSGGGVDPWHDSRSIPLPMPPLPRSGSAQRLVDAADRLGWGTLDVPLLINSVDYQGRSGCVRCGQCVGFACPVDAKAGTHNTALPAALATGLCTLVTETTAERLVTDARGRVTGVALVAADADGRIWRRTVDCAEVVVAAGATETPRLLLNSAHDHEPRGLGNNRDQVGRYLQAHVYAGAAGAFDDEVVDLLGPGVSIATCDFRHGNDGIVGGGMLANEFVATPASTYDYLTGAGLIPPAGAAGKQAMRREALRTLRVVGPIQEVTSAESRVRVDPEVTDRFGNAVVRISGSIHPEDVRTQAYMSDKARQWLVEAGAARTAVGGAGTARRASVGQHQAGTCRMGDDPARSVTDPYGRVWGHENVRIVDGSVHVTNGGVNPVLTILAGSLRIAEHLAGVTR
ncbi:choline dehydrogenase-like flavoprotein [Kribbella orskensis]|uniref:Choline dehydrogenase-like flavoprotein n=1 Tax=Kribbella orskensis TaxID=2512216 RepID=A0ABY2BMX4_9ACTN|nr:MULTISPECIES: GMC oxidoreductase [Kribbella]TCN41903.1 choline dehydrogenase-like flavoprotein [Kribbella sp. VKM Ac-2500]TCO25781.1 choline dehydrogenase-like flavoprotein [Kribbella orskensis]